MSIRIIVSLATAWVATACLATSPESILRGKQLFEHPQLPRNAGRPEGRVAFHLTTVPEVIDPTVRLTHRAR